VSHSTWRPEEHVDDLQATMYLDRRLDPSELDRVEAHLAACPGCREDLVATRGLLRTAGRSRQLVVAGTVTAFATIVFAAGSIFRSGAVHDGDPVLRTEGDAAALVSYGPSGEVGMPGLRFVWGSAAGVEAYRITISEEDGSSVWSGSVLDTAVTVPDSVALVAGNRYWWFVDALLEDGNTISTGAREFHVRK